MSQAVVLPTLPQQWPQDLYLILKFHIQIGDCVVGCEDKYASQEIGDGSLSLPSQLVSSLLHQIVFRQNAFIGFNMRRLGTLD